MKFVFLLLLIFPAINALLNDDIFNLILDYLKSKYIRLATIYVCWSYYDVIKLNRLLSENLIRANFITIDTLMNNFIEINDTTNPIFYDLYSYVIDLDCEDSQQFLEMDADLDEWQTRFHNDYKWLLLTTKLNGNASAVETFFQNVKLRMDSDVSLLHIYEKTFIMNFLYHTGIGRNKGRMRIKSMNIFVNKGKYEFASDESFYECRKNMSDISMYVSTVITQATTMRPEDYLINIHNRDDSLSKMNYALYLHMIEMHEFKQFRLLAANIWYETTNVGNNDGGLTQHLSNRLSDITATSGIVLPERIPLVDFIIPTYYFGTCFMFRNPSKIGKIRNQFFDPFKMNTWYICLLFCVVLCMLLKFTDNVHVYFELSDVEENTWSSSLLNTLAAFCQQDIEIDNKDLTGRILILSLMFLSLLLYNYYTSSIVSDLINSRTQAFQTIGDLVHSSMDLGMEDISYTARLLRTADDPDLIYLRDKKILVPGKKEQWYLPDEGIAKVKVGGFGYHVEPATGYPLIARTFEGDEICDLCEIYVLKQSLVQVFIQKKSQYKELFSISYKKMLERGIIKRQRMIWEARKPECLSSASVLQIELEQVAPAFFVVAVGILISFFILYLEIRMKKKIKLNKQSKLRR